MTRPVGYVRVSSVADAVATLASGPGRAFLAGGTTEVDLLRLGVADPDLLVDINDVPLRDVEDLPDGGLRIGATARMNDVARAPGVRRRYPGLSRALLLGASEQLRNMASMGGNLCQRTRCTYFRDIQTPCNKRAPGSGCSAMNGFNRSHAILGGSDHCIATHPSDAAVALVALDALVHTVGPDGIRAIPLDDFFVLPGDTPQRERALDYGELIVAIEVPGLPLAERSLYMKLRDRASYEFALVSVYAAVRVESDTVRDVRLALGGVATKPWRARRAEARLIDAPATTETFRAAADDELADAVPREYNAFKVELAKRAIVRALEDAVAGSTS